MLGKLAVGYEKFLFVGEQVTWWVLVAWFLSCCLTSFCYLLAFWKETSSCSSLYM